MSLRREINKYGLKNMARLLWADSCADGEFPTENQVLSFETILFPSDWYAAEMEVEFNYEKVGPAVCKFLGLTYDNTVSEIKMAFFQFLKGKTVDELPKCMCLVLDEVARLYCDMYGDSLEMFYAEEVGENSTVYHLPAKNFISMGKIFADEQAFHFPVHEGYCEKLAWVACAMPVRVKLPADLFHVVTSFILVMHPNESAFYRRLYKYFRVHHPQELDALVSKYFRGRVKKRRFEDFDF